jgi:hypothetical protein
MGDRRPGFFENGFRSAPAPTSILRSNHAKWPLAEGVQIEAIYGEMNPDMNVRTRDRLTAARLIEFPPRPGTLTFEARRVVWQHPVRVLLLALPADLS